MVPQRIILAGSMTLFSAAFGQDIEGALRIICPDGRVSHSRDGTAIGCQSCPARTGFADVPTWELHRAIMGHFTSAGAQNLLLSGRGCEPHSLYFGGTFIFDLGSRGPHLLNTIRVDSGALPPTPLQGWPQLLGVPGRRLGWGVQ